MGQALASLPADQRAEQHRQYGAEALIKSQAATDPAQQAEYLTVAAGWQALAVEAKRSLVAPLPGEFVSRDRHETASDDLTQFFSETLGLASP